MMIFIHYFTLIYLFHFLLRSESNKDKIFGVKFFLQVVHLHKCIHLCVGLRINSAEVNGVNLSQLQ